LNRGALKVVVLIALFLTIVPYLALAFFSHPAYDDFCNTVQQLKMGVLERQAFIYHNFDGRYFAVATGNLNPLRFVSFGGYKMLGLLIIVLTFLSIYAFVAALLKNSSRIDKLLVSAFLMALFSNQVPEVTELYYFMTGLIVYQVPTILTMLFLAVAIRSTAYSGGARRALTALGCVLASAVVGSNETSMLILAMIIAVVAFYGWLNRAEYRWQWTIFLIVTMISAAVVIFAPGNAVRASLLPTGQHRLVYSLGMSLRQEVAFLSIWFSNFAFILSTILFIPTAARFTDFLPFKKTRIHPLIMTGILLMLVFIGLFPAYWTMGMMGQHRTISTVYFFFLIGWFINIVVWVDYLKRKFDFAAAELPAYVYVIGVAVILVNLGLANNTRVAVGDLVRGRAYRYDRAVTERYSQFQQCARENRMANCETTRIADLPTTITNPYYEVEMDCEKRYWLFLAGHGQ
jgi:hypothetical protein